MLFSFHPEKTAAWGTKNSRKRVTQLLYIGCFIEFYFKEKQLSIPIHIIQFIWVSKQKTFSTFFAGFWDFTTSINSCKIIWDTRYVIEYLMYLLVVENSYREREISLLANYSLSDRDLTKVYDLLWVDFFLLCSSFLGLFTYELWGHYISTT